MINVINQQITDIPCLVIEPIEKQNIALPTVIYFHGFTSAKEHNLPFAYLLATKGYRVILPDSKHHGEREVNITVAERELSFWNIIFQNISDLNKLKNALDEKRLILNNRIGIAGTSMGGITTASALTQYEWIQSSAVLMGSPKLTLYANDLLKNYPDTAALSSQEELEDLFQKLEQLDLSKHMDSVANRPLLLWHGTSDVVVPADHSKSFYNEVRHTYQDKNNIKLLLEDRQGHKVSRYAIVETVKWFENHL